MNMCSGCNKSASCAVNDVSQESCGCDVLVYVVGDILSESLRTQISRESTEVKDSVTDEWPSYEGCKEKGLAPEADESVQEASCLKPLSPSIVVSAMKGGRKTQGIACTQLTVSWSPDVYDPLPTIVSHTVKNKEKRHSKSGKGKHKGCKASKQSGVKDKKQHRKCLGSAKNGYTSLDAHDRMLFVRHPSSRDSKEMMPLFKSAMSTDESELDIKRAELKASKLELEAEWADFRDKQQEWEETKVGGSSKVSDTKLEAENIQLRFAQTQLKAALSQLEDVMSKLESAQCQLEEARGQWETAARHLEAATARTEIKRIRVEASKASLEATKMRFESGTSELEDAKSKLDDAISQVEAAALSITKRSGTSAVVLDEENADLGVQVSQLQSVLSKLETRVGELEKDKLEQEDELEESKDEVQRLSAENSDLKADVHQLNNDNGRLEDELEQSRGMVERVKENKSKQDENKRLEERVTIGKSGNTKVFNDITSHGASSNPATTSTVFSSGSSSTPAPNTSSFGSGSANSFLFGSLANPSPFRASSSLGGFNAGCGFSLGTSGAKSNRRIIKPKKGRKE